jgi:hypothetical protein
MHGDSQTPSSPRHLGVQEVASPPDRLGVMHRRVPSNAWVKTDRHLVHATKVNREDFANYSLDEFIAHMNQACGDEIAETGEGD